jgi:uncharacterized damage-inducible protein DinB
MGAQRASQARCVRLRCSVSAWLHVAQAGQTYDLWVETRLGAPVAGGEKDALCGFLDHYRQVMLDVCQGLSEEQLRRPMTPSATSLLGLVKHLAYCEQGWFQEAIAGNKLDYPQYLLEDPDADMRATGSETADEILELYRRSCDASRRVLAGVSLDDPAKGDTRFDYNVRWIVLHMIEETARHAGHADILRELIDGHTSTGYD